MNTNIKIFCSVRRVCVHLPSVGSLDGSDTGSIHHVLHSHWGHCCSHKSKGKCYCAMLAVDTILLTCKPSEAGRFKQDALTQPMYWGGHNAKLRANAWWSKRPVSSSSSSSPKQIRTRSSQVDFGALAEHLIAVHLLFLSMCQLSI